MSKEIFEFCELTCDLPRSEREKLLASFNQCQTATEKHCWLAFLKKERRERHEKTS